MKPGIKSKHSSASLFTSNSVLSVSFDSVVPTPSPSGPICDCSISRLPRRSIVVKHSSSGSALILTLLITALLATIAVSFLSTSRIEQIAAKNFTRQNAAAGLAERATQQAMAKIQQGFTVNGTGTTIITTQPGAIWQFSFNNGNCTAVSGKDPTELFSTNGTINANLNNLQNPSSNSSASTNQFTITGNRTEQIFVPMENITSNGTIIGRVAYYVDDEGTKLNANSATGNRTTLNAGNRPQDITALVSYAASSFNSTINSYSSNISSVTGWSHLFRPEQVSAAVSGISGNHTPFISTATSSASTTANMPHLLTPWGTQRIAINSLSTNATNGAGDASVGSIFEALTGLNGTTMNATSNSAYGLTGRGLQNVFGGNFSSKYTPLGVKQIAANMLQMRDPNTNTINASFAYTGPLLGSSGNLSAEIPREYLGHAPYLVISEIGMSACLASATGGGTSYTYVNSSNETVTVPVSQADWGFKLQPVIELYNPYPVPFTIPAGAFPRVMLRPSRLTCNMSWSGANGNFTGNFAFGSSSSKPATWTYSSWFGKRSLSDVNQDQNGRYDLVFQANGNTTTIPPYSKIQTRLYLGTGVWEGAYTFLPLQAWSAYPHNGSNITIHSIRDIKIEFDRVILFANSGNNVGNATTGYSQTIRDWVRGDEIGKLDVEFDSSNLPYRFTGNGTHLNIDPNFNPPSGANGTAAPIPTKSAQRISHLTKIPLATPAITINNSNRNWTTTNATVSNIWLANGTSWVTSNSSNFGYLGTSNSSSTDTSLAAPSASANSTTPSDPSLGDSVSNAVYAGSNASDMREPFLLTGNYSCPADLGFVPTNQRWRRLRMQMQPSPEGSLIPDWAMLEVISFGNSTNPNNAFNRMVPVNINGRFYLPGNVSNSSPPAPRTIGMKALAQVLSFNGTGSIQDPMNASSSNPSDATRFKGNTANATTIANAIGNMEWSANSRWGNSTSNSTSFRRNALRFPANQYILPSEIMEIAGVADAVSQTDYNNSTSHFKWNEGSASALIPAVSTRSSFFTIYAYAQAGNEIAGTFVPDSEALTKTLVEVEIASPATATTPAQYKVKKLYTQPIPLGQ